MIENIYFSREYSLRESVQKVTIFFSEPAKTGNDFACRYQILGLSNVVDKTIYGIDQLQAFLLAVASARFVLLNSVEYRNGQIYWLDEDNMDLGLELPSV